MNPAGASGWDRFNGKYSVADEPHGLRIAVQGADLIHVVEYGHRQALGASRHSTPLSGNNSRQDSHCARKSAPQADRPAAPVVWDPAHIARTPDVFGYEVVAPR